VENSLEFGGCSGELTSSRGFTPDTPRSAQKRVIFLRLKKALSNSFRRSAHEQLSLLDTIKSSKQLIVERNPHAIR